MTQFPIAEKKPSSRTFHGRTLNDDYSWLEDKNDPTVMAYLEANNAYADEQYAHLAPLRETIFTEIKSRTKETDMSLPVRKGQWWFYVRTEEGKNYAAHYRLAAQDWTVPSITNEPAAGEELLLDSNELAQGHEYFALGALSCSEDGSLLLYATDTSGDERYDLRVKSLVTGEFLPDTLDGISSGAFFSLDGNYIFYQTVDEAWRPDSVWRHELGTDRSSDVRIFHEPDERFWVGIGYTRSKKYFIIESASKTTSETYIAPAANPTGEATSLQGRTEGVEYSVEHAIIGGKDYFIYVHNRDNPNFSLSWTEAEPGLTLQPLGEFDPQTRIEAIDAFADCLIVSARAQALPQCYRAELPAAIPDTRFTPVQLSSNSLCSVGLSANPDFTAPDIRFSYSSFTEPSRIVTINFLNGEQSILKEQEIVGEYHPDDYVSERLWAKAPDGALIPVSVVYHKNTTRPAPTLLYAYGAYESTIDPYFSISRLSLLDRGLVYAIAHVRGGGEMGRGWYNEGKMRNKKNTFSDTIAVAEKLKEANISGGIVLEGGSAGGLLVGATINVAPELFTGAVAIVPFVDTLNTILDPSLPLTVTEWDEWGDPLHDPEVFDYMASYSPYDNVAAKPYPAIFARTSLNDTRVRYSEAAKWVAALREKSTSGNPIHLKTELVAGHGGASGRYKKWEEYAWDYAWILHTLGISGR